MLSFAAPGFLLGLLGLPALRWLHRGGRHRRAVPVAHLALWRGAAASPPAAGTRRPPDPAWRRRALLAALLFAALAGPQWPQPNLRVTLWIDDSLSMLTRETQGTRLALGLAQARAQLAALGAAEVELRTLGEPWRALGTIDDAKLARLAAAAGRVPVAAPPAPLLRRDRQHWLVTDGAHAAVLQWPAGMRPDRLIQVGASTRNVGIEGLAARRSAESPERIDLLLRVANGGSVAETRELVIASDTDRLQRKALQLAPGSTQTVALTLPAAARVRATLQPGDALVEDDTLVLDLATLRRRRVATDGRCPPALRAAVAAHPALLPVPEDSADADAILDCSSAAAPRPLPTVRVRAERLPLPLRGSVQWSASVKVAQRPRLDAGGLQQAARLRVTPADEVLLEVGAEPVIVSRAGSPARVETSLDLAALGATRGPALPLLLNLMLERALGSALLDEVAVADRGAGASTVAPLSPVPQSPANADASPAPDAPNAAPAAARETRDATPALLLAALGVLLWEIVALVRQGLRLRAGTQAGTQAGTEAGAEAAAP